MRTLQIYNVLERNLYLNSTRELLQSEWGPSRSQSCEKYGVQLYQLLEDKNHKKIVFFSLLFQLYSQSVMFKFLFDIFSPITMVRAANTRCRSWSLLKKNRSQRSAAWAEKLNHSPNTGKKGIGKE